VRQVEAAEDSAGGPGVGEESEDAHVRSAVGAAEGEDLVDAGAEAGSAGAGRVAGEGGGGVLMDVCGCLVTRSSGRAIFGFGRVGIVAGEGDDPGPEPCDGHGRMRRSPPCPFGLQGLIVGRTAGTALTFSES
jgi:hypothetical protein